MKLPVASGEQTIKALARVGFVVVRQKGSHVRLEKEAPEGVIKITVPLHKTLKRAQSKIVKRVHRLVVSNLCRLRFWKSKTN